jgi:hypothetical protein
MTPKFDLTLFVQLRIQGTMYHMMGPANRDYSHNQRRGHDQRQVAQFAQLYVLDPEEAAATRLDIFGSMASRLKEGIMRPLSFLMDAVNPHARQCKSIGQVTVEEPVVEVELEIIQNGEEM